mmetsp:Transcript_4320/g.4293  ORF Transcript_4320/g.4293 Transcript_4320/m.4293 type:complete len:509 (+) Transcript_4320:2-1528(+)
MNQSSSDKYTLEGAPSQSHRSRQSLQLQAGGENVKPSQSVTFGVDNQEKSRRFTISSQPSSINLANPQVSESLPSSRKTSLQGNPNLTNSSRNNSTTSEIFQFFANNQTYAIKPQQQVSTGTSHGYITPSNQSSRVNSPVLETPPHLKKGYKIDDSSHKPTRLSSPSPPPLSQANISSQQSFQQAPHPINITNNSNLPRGSCNTKKSSKTVVASPSGPPVPFQQYLTKSDDEKIHILLGCTGSVATIKVPMIIDKLFNIYGKSKISIQLVVTKSATHFLKGLKIHSDVKIWRDEDEWANYNEHSIATTTVSTNNISASRKPKNPFDNLILHNELRKWADIFLIAPLSANTLAKITNGIADNLLTSIIRSWSPISTTMANTNVNKNSVNVKKPILVAPAMNTHMYIHPITAKQLLLLSSSEYGFGIEVLKPVEKVLVCGDIGMGGMREWLDIVDILRRRINSINYVSDGKRTIAENDEDERESDEGEEEIDDDDDDDDDDQPKFAFSRA